MKKVCILDYGSGNVKSVLNAFSTFSDCVVSNEISKIEKSTHFVLPGVGSFNDAMKRFTSVVPITELGLELEKGKPFLGICVGMQILGRAGFEFQKTQGLGLVEGTVERLDAQGEPLPHVGWNNLIEIENHPLLSQITEEDDFYFVHSYGFRNIPKQNILGSAMYGGKFPAVISKENIYGVQFHPEKSQKSGEKLIQNFLSIT